MGIYALINDNIVDKVLELSDEQVAEYARQYSIIISIENLLIQPQVGWVLQGNQLAPPAGQQVALNEMIKAKIKSFQDQAPELLRDLYVTNTLLGITTQQSDQMFDDYQDVLIRIREGAWPTALYRLSQKQPSGFVTQEMIDNWYNLIASRIV